jgi:hypothetical protein
MCNRLFEIIHEWNYNFFYTPYVCAPYVLIPEMNVAGKS